MSTSQLISERIGRTLYGLISLSLGLISLTMIVSALYDIWTSLHEKTLLTKALLDAVGFIVIGTAVFDVSRFLMEEEVLKVHGEETSRKQRVTLIKFLVIIIIAVSLEALVFVFSAAKKDVTLLVYPTFLLLTAVMFVIGLGLYQRMTREGKKGDRLLFRSSTWLVPVDWNTYFGLYPFAVQCVGPISMPGGAMKPRFGRAACTPLAMATLLFYFALLSAPARLYAEETMPLTLSSSAFQHLGEIPSVHTCEGDDSAPPLEWEGVSADARSLVLIVDDPDAPDPDAPRMTWVHWVLYNLPPDPTGLPGGATSLDLPLTRSHCPRL